MRIGPYALLVVVLLASCASPQPRRAAAPDGGEQPAAPARTLVAAIRVEPPTVATKPLQTAGVGLYLPVGMFNAHIASLDSNANIRPQLVEAIPQLNSDDWQLLPDGRMEVTYRLKPNLVWHDGTAFSADDFVFAYRVYSTPALGHSAAAPYREIEQVHAPDARTLVIRFRQPYPDIAFTGGLNVEFPALPRHVLEQALNADELEPFVNHPFWTREFVGLGPYRMSSWEPGAFIEATAFDQYVLGRPRIERIRLDFVSDQRTVLTRLLAGETHLTDGTSLGLPEVATLKQQGWIPQQGDAAIHPNQWRAAHFQNRPEFATPAVLLNPTIRKALAHAVDKELLNATLYDSLAIEVDSLVAPGSIWGTAAQRGAIKYPFDLRLTEEAMQQAGYRKGADGVYTSPTEGRLAFTHMTNQGADNETEMAALASGWRQAGFEVEERVLSAAEARDPEKRSTHPAVFSHSQNCCTSALSGLHSRQVSSAATRWTGTNRHGWSNPEYDRLVDAFGQTLVRSEREAQVTQMVRVMTEAVAQVSLVIRGQPWTYVTGLRGVTLAPPEANMSWNIHEWEFR